MTNFRRCRCATSTRQSICRSTALSPCRDSARSLPAPSCKAQSTPVRRSYSNRAARQRTFEASASSNRPANESKPVHAWRSTCPESIAMKYGAARQSSGVSSPRSGTSACVLCRCNQRGRWCAGERRSGRTSGLRKFWGRSLPTRQVRIGMRCARSSICANRWLHSRAFGLFCAVRRR